MANPNRFVPICDTCWERVNPDQYFPSHEFRLDSENCAVCGEMTWANVHIRQHDVDTFRVEDTAYAMQRQAEYDDKQGGMA